MCTIDAGISIICWFSAKALPILFTLISFQWLSFPSVVSSQTFPGHFPCSTPPCDQWLSKEGPHSYPCQSSCYPFLCLVNNWLLATDVTLFHTRFQIFFISVSIQSRLIITKFSCSGLINISIIWKSHNILKKSFFIASVRGRSLAIDRQSRYLWHSRSPETDKNWVSSFWFNIRQVSLIVSPWRTTMIWERGDLDPLVWLVI